jgi:hypothetical protein
MMESIQFRSDNAAFMQSLSDQLAADLQKAGLGADLQVNPPVSQTEYEPTRGDPVTLLTVAVTAVGAGGAISVLLGKDGFLSALARVLETYVEGRKAELLFETSKGEKIKISGPAGEIKTILKQARD